MLFLEQVRRRSGDGGKILEGLNDLLNQTLVEGDLDFELGFSLPPLGYPDQESLDQAMFCNLPPRAAGHFLAELWGGRQRSRRSCV